MVLGHSVSDIQRHTGAYRLTRSDAKRTVAVMQAGHGASSDETGAVGCLGALDNG